MNILLTGAAGQLGSELLPVLSTYGSVTATDRCKPAIAPLNWLALDISNGAKLEALLDRSRPGLIVNAAAYTAVDQAEADPETAFSINAELPARLAAWAKSNDALLIHYSTDYVFDGKADRPYLETDHPNPKGVYGASKLAGERALEEAACKYTILRTSWLYSSHGKNFVKTMLELAHKGVALKVVDDQRGCPTWARNLAHASGSVIEAWQAPVQGKCQGVFHYCDGGSLSWYEFAREIFDFAVGSGLLNRLPGLTPVSSKEFPQPAERPQWSVLDTSRITEVFDIHPADFGDALKTVIDEIETRA